MIEPSPVPLETPAEEAARLACPSRPLIDIRSDEERQLGIPAGPFMVSCEGLPELERVSTGSADPGGFILCAEGVRSLEAVARLRKSGFSGYSSVAGGFRAWQAAGLPVGYPDGFSEIQVDRYARHLVMPQVGPEGQRKLFGARVLLAGLGGLNSPVALYLAAAGVGTLGLVDFDDVELSNLQLQILHGEGWLGRDKTGSAAERIKDLNPGVKVEIFDQRIDEHNARTLVEPWDVVVDGTDSFPSRYALNDACLALSLIHI